MTNLDIASLNVKDNIFLQAYNHFVKSNDYNGFPLYNIIAECTREELVFILQELIQERKIDIITGTSNNHIKSFDVMNVEEQVRLLPTLSINDYCIYPTEEVLRDNRDVAAYEHKPFSKLMALGKPQLKCCFFKIEILYKYVLDPRFDFSFSDYSGSIYSNNNVDDADEIHIKSFGVGRNVNDYIVAVFLRDLGMCSESVQQQWFSKIIKDQSHCKVIESFLKNQFECCWDFPRTIYRVVTEEVENVYTLTKNIWGIPLFKHAYDKTSEKLRGFDMLLLPTNKNLDDFYIQLEIITVENLNKEFFKIKEFALQSEVLESEGDYIIKKEKGTLQLFKDWLTNVKPDFVSEIHGVLNRLRTLRSKGSAHNLIKDEYSKELYNTQFNETKAIADALYLLRKIIQSHPRAHEVTIPHNSDSYIIL